MNRRSKLQTVSTIETGYEDTLWTTAKIDQDLPLRTLSDFDQRHYSIWISKRLLSEVKDFTFWVNEYRLFRFPLSAFDTEPLSNDALELFLTWHPALTRALIEQPWVTLHLKYDPSHHYFYSEAAPGNLTTDFATYTPVKDLDRPYGD